MTREYPNGTTQPIYWLSTFEWRQTRRTETSKYPEEEKTKVISLVVAIERETAQTHVVSAMWGL